MGGEAHGAALHTQDTQRSPARAGRSSQTLVVRVPSAAAPSPGWYHTALRFRAGKGKSWSGEKGASVGPAQPPLRAVPSARLEDGRDGQVGRNS